MKHNSVFSAPFDVPKLGTGAEYKPPELIYNELYENPVNHFSNMIPNSKPENHYRNLPEKKQNLFATPAPFLPTPAKEPFKPKPFSEYGELYDSPKKSYNKVRIKKPTYENHAQTKIPPFVPPPTKTSTPAQKKGNYRSQYTDNNVEQNFFKPMNSPSITFEPDFTNEIDDSSRYYNGDMLHAIVQSEFDYEEPQAREEPVFLPFTDDRPVEPVARAESVVTPVPSNFLKSNFFNEVSEPRYKRYQTVDYSPQSPESYNYEPQKFNAPYPPEPYHAVSPEPYHQPTPEPAHFKHQVPAFLPPPESFTLDTRKPDFKSPDYYSPEYHGPDYYAPDYHENDFHEHDYPGHDYHEEPLNLDFPSKSFEAPLNLRPKGRSLWDDDVTTNANQFINVADVETFEHGHVRGNPVHKKQEYTRREGKHFKSQVTWADGDEGYGKHYFEYNH